MRRIVTFGMFAVLVAAQDHPANLSGVWTLRTDTAEQAAESVTVVISHDLLRLKIIELRQKKDHTVLVAHEYPLGRGKLELRLDTSSDLGAARVRGDSIEI